MTVPGQGPIPPVVPAVARPDGDDDDRVGPVLGIGDQDEDTARDSDGTPVGRADAQADAERTGADPDVV
jgi:hypothetical protein